MNLIYSQEAKERICHLPPEIKRGVRQTVESIREDPLLGKPLRRELIGFWSIRYKRYRVIYQWEEDDKSLKIHSIGRRERIYEDFTQSLKPTFLK